MNKSPTPESREAGTPIERAYLAKLEEIAAYAKDMEGLTGFATIHKQLRSVIKNWIHSMNH